MVPDKSPHRSTGTVSVIGICGATGGPQLIQKIVSGFPGPLSIPVLIVQQMSDGMEDQFVNWLKGTTGQAVAIAEDGNKLRPGVWIGRAGKHLTLGDDGRIVLLSREKPTGYCPSGDVLFRSLTHLGSKAAGVLVDGMGRDGVEGLLSLKQAGGQTLIPDQNSSLVWGSPRFAKECGAVRHELSPQAIADFLSQMIP